MRTIVNDASFYDQPLLRDGRTFGVDDHRTAFIVDEVTEGFPDSAGLGTADIGDSSLSVRLLCQGMPASSLTLQVLMNHQWLAPAWPVVLLRLSFRHDPLGPACLLDGV